jgi:ParB/RepB/Spo0J family partition protein
VSDLKKIPVSLIIENKAALRDVDRETEQYAELVDSVRSVGILNPILVREVETEEGLRYGLIDGLHRYNAAQDAGLSEVPVHIKSKTDAESWEAQLIGNAHRIETKPVEYSKHIQRILSQNPMLTLTEMAKKLSKSTKWVADRLSLLKLSEGVAQLVDEGKINLSNAFALSRLPEEEQGNWIDRAMTMTPPEFMPAVSNRKKELDKARRQGRSAETEEFAPVPTLQKLATIKDEYANPKFGPALIDSTGAETAADGFRLAIEWALNLDPQSVAAQRQKHDDRLRKREEAREAAAKERSEKKGKEAAIKSERYAIIARHTTAGTDATEELAAFDKANGIEKKAKTEAAAE